MNKKILANKFRQYPFAMVCFGLSIALLVFGYFSNVNSPDLQAEYDLLNKQKTIVDYNVNNSFELQKNIEELEVLDQGIRKRLLNPSDRAHNFHYLFALEKQTGVKIENPRQLRVVPLNQDKKSSDSAPSIAITYFKIDATGTFNQILKFIYNLQTGSIIGRIQKFSLETSKRLDSGILSISLEIGFFGIPD